MGESTKREQMALSTKAGSLGEQVLDMLMAMGEAMGLTVDGDQGEIILRFPHDVSLRVTFSVEVD